MQRWILKKVKLTLIQRLAEDVKDVHENAAVDKPILAERDAEIDKLNLKAQLFADNYEKIAKLQAQVTVWGVKIAAMRAAASRSTKACQAMTRNPAILRLELDLLHAAGDTSRNVYATFRQASRNGVQLINAYAAKERLELSE